MHTTKETMDQFLAEFFPLAIAHFIALIIPGPDFAIVLKQSITHGKKTALYTSLGIGTALSIHVALGLLGTSILIAQSDVAFSSLQYLGAAYLLYLGMKSIRATPSPSEKAETKRPLKPSLRHAFLSGFFTNALNPKVTLFCLSLFSVIIAPTTSTEARLIYAAYMSLSTVTWFSFLSVVLGNTKVRNFFRKKAYWFERVMGVVFIALSIRIAFAATF